MAARLARAALLILFLTICLAAATLLILISRNRGFQVDEIEAVHAAYNIAVGKLIYRDFRQSHTPLLYLLLAPLMDSAAPFESFLRARAAMLAFFSATVAAAAYAAARLRGAAGALGVVGLLLLHSTFIERGMEVRPDIALALCIAVALAVELSERPALARAAIQGGLLGLGFLFTQKTAIASLGFGLIWLQHAVKARRSSLVLVPCLAWAALVTGAVLVSVLAGNVDAFLEQNLFRTAKSVAAPGAGERFSLWLHLQPELQRNWAFAALFVVGLGVTTARAVRGGPEQQRARAVATLAWVLLAGLLINPFPFPYFHVSLLPVAGVLAASVLPRPAAIGWVRALLLVCVALGAQALTSAPRLLSKASPAGHEAQRRFLHELDRVTGPDDAVFDLVGLYFRPDAYETYCMTGVMLGRYRRGEYPRIIPALRENQTVAVGHNYRTTGLPPDELRFIGEHFIHWSGNLFVLGRTLSNLSPGAQQSFEVLKSKDFRFEGEGALLVDGQPFVRGRLERGLHTLSAAAPIPRGRLVLDAPPPERFEPTFPMFVNFD